MQSNVTSSALVNVQLQNAELIYTQVLHCIQTGFFVLMPNANVNLLRRQFINYTHGRIIQTLLVSFIYC